MTSTAGQVGLNCPECQWPESDVLDSRPRDGAIRRRRKCCGCGARWTTYETNELPPDDGSIIDISALTPGDRRIVGLLIKRLLGL